MANRDYENQCSKQGYKLIAGCDEAGRGPLAGPLVASAVIFPLDYNNPLINDSKKLSSKVREELYDEIINNAISYEIVVLSNEDVDKLNPYRASQIAMTKCIENIQIKPDVILTDAMPLPKLDIPVIDIIKGDAKSITIAAASILSKVTRDRLMIELDSQYPNYDFKNNKGYGTKKHLNALEEYGYCLIHRKTYEPIKSMIQKQLSFDLYNTLKNKK